MARTKTLQTSFSAGELSPDLGMRQDTKQYANGAKSLRNRRCLIGGGTRRRPATWHQADLSGPSRDEPFIVNQTTRYVVVFSDGRVDAFVQDIVTKRVTAAGSVTGCPWVGNTTWREMDYVQSANTAFLVHKGMPIQVLTRTGAASWTVTPFAFFVGTSSRPEQPYFKLQADAVRLAPSALTGLITLTATAAVFVAAHVGTYIRYLSKAILITAVTGPFPTTTATGTVIETLPRTQRLTVTATSDFALDELVQGLTSGAKGQVTQIVDPTTLDVVVIQQLTPFAVEQLIGPNGKTAISAVVDTTPASVKDWQEQLFSPIYGYPSCVEIHRNRLCLGGHPSVPDALITSRLNNLYSFNIDDGSDADAIFETIGDAGASQIVQLHSAEQLIVLTDHGPYYVPESQNAPFRPSGMAFFPFGSPWPVTRSAKARQFDGGVLFCSGSLVVKAVPTGNLSQVWAAHEVSLLSSHIISNPTRLAVTSNFAGGPERYAMIINDNGTMAAMQLVEQEEIRNITPWDTAGAYTSVAAIEGDLYVTTERTVGGSLRYFLEWFDQSITVDLATQYASAAALATIPDRYGATPVRVLAGTLHLGTFPLAITTLPPGPFQVGLYYDSTIETMVPVIQDPEGSKAGEFMRICIAYVTVKGSYRFAMNGYTISAYQVTDPVDAPPPVRNGPIKFEPAGGWKLEPTLTINQPDPLPLDILAIKSVVAF